jgi:hypothetical protein
VSAPRKPESELEFRDHEPHEVTGPVKVGRTSFTVGDLVVGPDRFGRTVTGIIGRLERMDTKVSATSVVTYRKTPVYYASVQHFGRPNLSTLIDVRKLHHQEGTTS